MDKVDEAIERVCAHFGEPQFTISEEGMTPEQLDRFTTEIPAGALKHGGHIYVSGSATATAVAEANLETRRRAGGYLWRNQYASVSSWADNMRPAFDRWMWSYRALCAIRQALDHPQRGVKGCGLGLLRKGVRKFMEASPKDSNGCYELKTAVRLLSTKRGRKLARKAGVNVDALREKLEAWPKSQQPDIMATSKAAFENMVVVYQELT